MRHTRSFRWSVFAAAVVGAGLLAWPAAGAAQTVVGDAKAVQATTFGLIGGTTTVLADTGWLSGPSDVLDASLITGDVPSLLSGEVLDGLTVAGIPISADFVMATATAPLGAAATGSSLIENLSINGVPIDVTGEPNQTISIPGGQVVLNEQTASPSGTTVNALHAVVSGVADVVVASATAGIQ